MLKLAPQCFGLRNIPIRHPKWSTAHWEFLLFFHVSDAQDPRLGLPQLRRTIFALAPTKFPELVFDTNMCFESGSASKAFAYKFKTNYTLCMGVISYSIRVGDVLDPFDFGWTSRCPFYLQCPGKHKYGCDSSLYKYFLQGAFFSESYVVLPQLAQGFIPEHFGSWEFAWDNVTSYP